MKKYFRVYTTLISLNFAQLSAFRGNFYNSAFGHMSYAVFTVVIVFLLTSKTKVVFGWTREELFVMVGVFNIFSGIFRTIFTQNLDRIPYIINQGELDHFLLKPIDSQFLLSTRNMNLAAILRTPAAIVFILYVLSLIDTPLTFQSLALFIIATPISIILLYSIWFIVLTTAIWFTNLNNMDRILDQVTSATRYPKKMFEQVPFLVFFVLPIALIVTVPTEILLLRPSMNDFILLFVISITMLKVSRMFWKFALRHYSSASS